MKYKLTNNTINHFGKKFYQPEFGISQLLKERFIFEEKYFSIFLELYLDR